MSSNTRVQATPVYNVSIEEADSVSLLQVLGRGGCEALLETLEGQEGAGTVQIPEPAWQKVGTEPPNRQLYRRVLSGSALSAELQSQGVSEVTLDLKVGRQMAEVRRSTAYRTEQRETEAVRTALRALSNRAVNELLALAVTQRLTQQLTEHVGNRGEVRMSRVNERQIEALQKVQQRAHYQASAYVQRG
jgi:hypothetical protein